MTRWLAPLLALSAAAAAGTSYDVEVTLDAEAKVFQGVARVAFQNDSKEPIDLVPFRLDLNRTGRDDGWMQVGQVVDGRGTSLELEYLKDRDGKDLGEFPSAKLASPLAPGEGTTLDVHFAGGVSADTPTFWMDDNDRGTTGAIFPRLVARGGEDWLRDEWTPADFRVTIVAPEGYHVAASGRQAGREGREGGLAATTFESRGARGFAMVADPSITETSTSVGNVEVRVAGFGSVPDAERIAREAKDALVALATDLGPYPHASLVLLVSDRTLDLTSSHGFVVLPRSLLADDGDLVPAIAFAVARGWWGDVVSDAGTFPRWLTSGFALLSTEPHLLRRFPERSFRDEWTSLYASAALEGVDTTIAQPVRGLWSADFAWDRVISMGKGYAILRLFSRRFPTPSLAERRGRLLAERHGGVATIEDLVSACPEADRADAREFLRAWTMTDCEVDYAVSRVEAADGKTRVRIARKGNATAPVDVEGTTPDGKAARASWDGLGEQGEVVLGVPSEGVRVRLDPEGWLPDIDRSDDEWFWRPKGRADLRAVAFRRVGKAELAVEGDDARWRGRFTLDVSPQGPIDVGIEVVARDADGVVERTVVVARQAGAGKAIEGSFRLAGPDGTQRVRARVYAASSEAELDFAARHEKPSWEKEEEFEADPELHGAKVGPVEWPGDEDDAGVAVPLTLPGKGKARVGFEARVSMPGRSDRVRFGKAFDMERGKEARLELTSGGPIPQVRVEVELRIGLLVEGENRLRPGQVFWVKRKVFGGK